jgi:hypothetical protein
MRGAIDWNGSRIWKNLKETADQQTPASVAASAGIRAARITSSVIGRTR